MNKNANCNSNSDWYYEQRYRDNWNHAVRRAAFSEKEVAKINEYKREYWSRNKERLNRNRREAYFLKNKNAPDEPYEPKPRNRRAW